MRALLFILAFLSFADLYGQSFNQEGKASYYANKFEGRLTASGERFSNHKMTAAHRSLPFGTTVLVTNLSNQKTVIVKINDRGPFIKGRIIDVSQKAAKKLGFYHQGITRVKIKVCSGFSCQDSLLQIQKSLTIPPFPCPKIKTELMRK